MEWGITAVPLWSLEKGSFKLLKTPKQMIDKYYLKMGWIETTFKWPVMSRWSVSFLQSSMRPKLNQVTSNYPVDIMFDEEPTSGNHGHVIMLSSVQRQVCRCHLIILLILPVILPSDRLEFESSGHYPWNGQSFSIHVRSTSEWHWLNTRAGNIERLRLTQ